jgi:hypothetical protein
MSERPGSAGHPFFKECEPIEGGSMEARGLAWWAGPAAEFGGPWVCLRRPWVKSCPPSPADNRLSLIFTAAIIDVAGQAVLVGGWIRRS